MLTRTKTSFRKTNFIVRRKQSEDGKKANHRIHTNDGHEIYMLIEGDVSFSIDGVIYKLEPYDMLLISNKEIHKTIINDNGPYEREYIYFDPEYMAQFSDKDYDLLKMFESRRWGFGNKISREIVLENGLDKYLDEMQEWYASEAPEKYAMITSILIKLLVKINAIRGEENIEAEGGSSDLNYNEKVYQIIRYFSSNIDRKISLDELEKEFYINKYHLCHLFKKVTGFTVMEYMNYKKILIAREKLKKGVPISEVWSQSGFDDYSSFYRCFKKVSHMSPKEYAEAAKKKI